MLCRDCLGWWNGWDASLSSEPVGADSNISVVPCSHMSTTSPYNNVLIDAWKLLGQLHVLHKLQLCVVGSACLCHGLSGARQPGQVPGGAEEPTSVRQSMVGIVAFWQHALSHSSRIVLSCFAGRTAKPFPACSRTAVCTRRTAAGAIQMLQLAQAPNKGISRTR